MLMTVYSCAIPCLLRCANGETCSRQRWRHSQYNFYLSVCQTIM